MTVEAIRRAISSRTPRRLEVIDFPGYSRASVLMPLVETADGLSLILTVRTQEVESHKGQISFPGGVMEPGDADETATALREAREEIGLQEPSMEILGVMDDYPVPSGYIVTPVAAFLHHMPVLVPQPGEVSEVFTVPLSFFADARNGRVEQRFILSRSYDVWHFQRGEYRIWGATAAMIRGLLGLLE